MKLWQARLIGLGLGVTTLVGCTHILPIDGTATTVRNVEFMTLWKTYSHCRSSSDPNEMRADAERLRQAVQTQASTIHPKFLGMEADTALPSRLTVDPQAMVMACSLHAGQTAQSLGRRAIALEMFNMIVTINPEPKYAYYVSEASRRLEQLEHSAPNEDDAHSTS